LIYSIYIIRLFIIFIIVFGLLVIYTAYMISKYNFIQDKKKEIFEAYTNFILLYDEDRYFSKREYNYWFINYKYLKSIISDYKYHINKIKKYAESINSLNDIIQRYMNIFLVPEDYERVINYLFNFFNKGINLIESRNQEWVKNELENYRHFFDDQDGHSLTPSQRKNILIDEANNLVVAGAGTGKTLTLVSKVGYILKKQLVNPDEILILAYTNKAKDELEERIKRIYNVDMNIRTFHSFGNEIIGKSTGSKPSLSELSKDDALLLKTLEGFLQKQMKEIKYANTINNYFVYYLNPVENDLTITTQEEYEAYLEKIQIRTLRGELVKSLAELELSNFFFINGVEYEYEKEYIVDTSSETRRQYTPDFYLPEQKIWIEHIGIDRNGNTAPEVDQLEYIDSWFWKRKLHIENSTELLETYSYQYSEGTLISDLIPQLTVRGVKFKKIPEEQIFDSLRNLGEVSQFVGLLMKFIQLFKSSNRSFSEIREKASNYPYAKRYLAFLDVFEPIFRDYEDWLAKTGKIDYADMINKATKYVQNGSFESPFKYILVDEFQDISQSRYRLLKSLLDQNWRTKIFCVGDDWQSIYRFSGSDLSIMTSFEKYFEPCEIMYLNETFRFNDKIEDFSSTFITKNPSQYRKKLVSRPSDRNAIHLIWYSDLNEAINQTLDKIEKLSVGSEVLILGRYNKEFYKDLDPSQYMNLKSEPQRKLFEEEGLLTDLFTIHSSKGKEADYVILLGLKSGSYGFPCEIEDDPVLNLVLSEDDKYPNAEERRVFYVGVTRAKNKVYLLANRGRVSSFVTEVLSGEYEIEIFGDPPKLVKCPECGKGVINRIEWDDDFFFSCSRYPICKYKPKKCPSCMDGFLYLDPIFDDKYRCSNEDCSFSPKKCPDCDGYLVRRTGNPDFYGCSNFAKNNCRYKEPLETIEDVYENSGPSKSF